MHWAPCMSTLEIHYIMHNPDKLDCRELRTSGARTPAPGQLLVVMKWGIGKPRRVFEELPPPKRRQSG